MLWYPDPCGDDDVDKTVDAEAVDACGRGEEEEDPLGRQESLADAAAI